VQLVKCRKCGATIMSTDTLLSNMQDEYNELNKRCQKAKPVEKQILIQQMAHINRLMRQALHNSSELELRKSEAYYELKTLREYLINNNIVDYELLDKIRDKARVTAKEKVAESQIAINKLYGEFRNICSNNTKSDPTAREAIKRT
jgi:hypothetical protein